MNKKTLITILEWGVIALFVATPLFYVREGVYPYIFSKTLLFQGLVELVCGVWLVLAYTYKEFRPKKTALLYSLSIFLIVLIGTSALGIDFTRSFWSTQERMLGIFTWLHLGALFLVLQSASHTLQWRRIMISSMAAAVCVSCLAFLQLWYPNLLLNEAVGNRPGATFGNPTFLSGYLLIHLYIGAYLLIKNLVQKSLHKKDIVLLMISMAIFFVAMINAQTRGDIGALALGIVPIIGWFCVFPPQFPKLPLFGRKAYITLLLLLLVGGTGFYFTRTASLWQKIPGISRIAATSFESTENVPRRAAWHAAWEGFKEKPFTGVGWENFNVVFNKHYNPAVLQLGYQETRFDKPHNALLEYLVTGGAPLFIAYLGLFLALLYTSYKLDKYILTPIVLGGVVAYHIRNSVVFETLGLVMMLIFTIAFIDAKKWEKDQKHSLADVSKKYGAHPDWVVAAICIGVGIVMAYSINYRSALASYYQYYGFTNFVRNKFPQAIASFRAANDIGGPYQWNLQRDYARAVAEAYFYNPGKVPKDEAMYAVEQLERATKDHPSDAVTHGMLVDLYNQIYDINPQEYGRLAWEHGERALELSPNRQEVYFSLSKTKTLEKDYKGALALLDKALSLAPSIPDSHFYYGLVAYADNQPEKGYEHIKKAIDLGRKWKNNNEPRVVANFFADSGHIDEAIELYKKALEFKKDDTEARLKLGVAYFAKGDRENAREVIAQAMKEFDLTQSPSYPELLPILKSLGLM